MSNFALSALEMFQPSEELIKLLQDIELEDQQNVDAPRSCNDHSTADRNPDAEVSFTTASNSTQDSLEFAFGSLELTSSQLDEIDRESAPLPTTNKPESGVEPNAPPHAAHVSITTTVTPRATSFGGLTSTVGTQVLTRTIVSPSPNTAVTTTATRNVIPRRTVVARYPGAPKPGTTTSTSTSSSTSPRATTTTTPKQLKQQAQPLGFIEIEPATTTATSTATSTSTSLQATPILTPRKLKQQAQPLGFIEIESATTTSTSTSTLPRATTTTTPRQLNRQADSLRVIRVEPATTTSTSTSTSTLPRATTTTTLRQLNRQADSLRVTKTQSAKTETPTPGLVHIHRKFKFSPSVLAHHANTACEKMLHLKGAELWTEAQQPKNQTNISKSSGDTQDRTIAQAHQDRGLDFESRLQQGIANKVDCEREQDTDSFFRLATTAIGTTLCQPFFSLDPSFYTPTMIKAGIGFGRFIPDFIRILPGSKKANGKPKNRLFIIDAKSSLEVKMSHQFQVTLYVIFLEHLIKVNKQEDNIEIASQGGVWIPSDPEPKTFSLSFMRPVVEKFIQQELPFILSKPFKDVEWHIDSACQQCEYLPECRKDAVAQNTLSVIPLLTKKSALWIKTLFKRDSGQSELDDLEDLMANFNTLSESQRTTLSTILRINDDGKSVLLESVRKRKTMVLPVRTLELPMKFNERLLVNVLFNPFHNLPYAFALTLCKDQLVVPSRTLGNTIQWSDDPAKLLSAHVSLTEEFIETLHTFLTQISRQSYAPILSIFFYSRSTQTNVENLLLKIVSHDPTSRYRWKDVTKTRAMELLGNMYEDASFLTMPEVAGKDIRLPDLLDLTNNPQQKTFAHDKRVFSIEAAIRTLLVLSGGYSFANIMTHLVDIEIPDVIPRSDRRDQEYNDNSFLLTWTSGYQSTEVNARLQKWANQQNVILLALYGLLRDECKNLGSILLASQKPFKMRSRLNLNSSILAQFAYFTQWETIVGVQRLREKRVLLSREDSFEQQVSFQMEFVERVGNIHLVSKSSEYIAKFIVTSKLSPGVLANDSFPEWVLSADTVEGQERRAKYDDMKDVLNIYNFGTPAVVGTESVDYEKKIVYLKGSYHAMTVELDVEPGKKYILERRLYAPNLNTTLKKLVELDSHSNLFLELVSNPNKWGLQCPTNSKDVFLESIMSSARHYDMTISQDQAFSKVIQQHLQIIWGPPGSGKTQFLALTILKFIDIMRGLSMKGKGKGPQTIVLTALTHAAIDNLVARILKLHNTIAPRAGFESMIRPLTIYRLGSYDKAAKYEGVITANAADLAAKSRRNEDPRDNDIVRIVCGTVWAIRKTANGKNPVPFMQNVQMLMIDEGSQLLTVDALHAIEILDPKAGRLIVAGDHLQLGPVIVGDYPSSSQTIDPTGSIMMNLMRTTENKRVNLQWDENRLAQDVGPCTSQLQDNFRMNKQLGVFMHSIYGPGFKVQNPSKALPYGSNRGMTLHPEIRKALDPEHSAVCIELQLTSDPASEVTQKVRTNTRTAALIEGVVVAALLESYLTMVGVSTITSVFVAIPHHVQRLAIRHAVDLPKLEQKFPLAHIKIDTVEKMQGQEADLVIVGFAMFGDGTVAKELRHLFSVHRWVVALSRARCKTILLITPELLTPRIMGGTERVNAADMDYLDGWGMLRAFDQYAQSTGGKSKWPIGSEFLAHLSL
ncbi:Tripartite DNA replication factor [Podila epigama]|nr:Tripartite DNA replication factor [Podila epigama]